MGKDEVFDPTEASKKTSAFSVEVLDFCIVSSKVSGCCEVIDKFSFKVTFDVSPESPRKTLVENNVFRNNFVCPIS